MAALCEVDAVFNATYQINGTNVPCGGNPNYVSSNIYNHYVSNIIQKAKKFKVAIFLASN